MFDALAEVVKAMTDKTNDLDAREELMQPRLALARDFPGCTPRVRCFCGDRFKRTDAVLSIKGQGTREVTEVFIHRRCIEGLMRFGVIDEQDAVVEFEQYRSGILQRLA